MVAIQKVVGIETEYGIVQRGVGETNPISASSVLINAYVAELARDAEKARVGWDFEDESPGTDARGFAPEVPMDLDLTPELQKFVDDQVRSGAYASAGAVVRQALVLLKAQDELTADRRITHIREIRVNCHAVAGANAAPRLFLLFQKLRGDDERDMGECLWKISQ